jgi:hypothetical protein
MSKKNANPTPNRCQQAKGLMKSIKQSCKNGEYKTALKLIDQLQACHKEEYHDQLKTVTDKPYCSAASKLEKERVHSNYITDCLQITLLRDIIKNESNKNQKTKE